MAEQFIIDIDEAGQLRFVAKPELLPLTQEGTAEIHRASHVLPVNPVLRVAFRVLRWVFGDEGRAADCTRNWPCKWSVEIIGGPNLGVYDSRSEAIDVEVAWVYANLL